MASLSLFTPDFTTTVVIATSGTDASGTIPAQGNSGQMTDQSSWWYFVVAGEPAYINTGAAATSANALIPVTSTFPHQPIRLAPGLVVHALASTGTGQVSFIKARVGQ
jgi:hypothetical protein